MMWIGHIVVFMREVLVYIIVKIFLIYWRDDIYDL